MDNLLKNSGKLGEKFWKYTIFQSFPLSFPRYPYFSKISELPEVLSNWSLHSSSTLRDFPKLLKFYSVIFLVFQNIFELFIHRFSRFFHSVSLHSRIFPSFPEFFIEFSFVFWYFPQSYCNNSPPQLVWFALTCTKWG